MNDESNALREQVESHIKWRDERFFGSNDTKTEPLLRDMLAQIESLTRDVEKYQKRAFVTTGIIDTLRSELDAAKRDKEAAFKTNNHQAEVIRELRGSKEKLRRGTIKKVRAAMSEVKLIENFEHGITADLVTYGAQAGTLEDAYLAGRMCAMDELGNLLAIRFTESIDTAYRIYRHRPLQWRDRGENRVNDTVQVPRDLMLRIRGVFLPANPNKLRSACQQVKDDAHAFIRLATSPSQEATPNALSALLEKALCELGRHDLVLLAKDLVKLKAGENSPKQGAAP